MAIKQERLNNNNAPASGDMDELSVGAVGAEDRLADLKLGPAPSTSVALAVVRATEQGYNNSDRKLATGEKTPEPEAVEALKEVVNSAQV